MAKVRAMHPNRGHMITENMAMNNVKGDGGSGFERSTLKSWHNNRTLVTITAMLTAAPMQEVSLSGIDSPGLSMVLWRAWLCPLGVRCWSLLAYRAGQ